MNSQARPQVSFFTTPQNDELLDSLVYRYHRLSGNPHPLDTLRVLYGKAPSAIPKMLTNQVSHLLAVLPPHLFPDEHEILFRHTLLPAFSRMLRPEKMATSVDKSLNSIFIGVEDPYHSRDLRLIQDSLQCCPHCIHEEQESLGVVYWHRSHQLHGVVVCHKHGCDLIQHCPHCGRKTRLDRSMDMPTGFCLGCGKRWMPAYSYPPSVRRLAELAHIALFSNLAGTNLARLSDIIRDAVGEHTTKLCKDINKRYGKRYLDKVHGEDETAQLDWLQGLFRPEVWEHRYTSTILQFYRYSDLLMVIDSLFGSWLEYDQRADEYCKAA